MFRGAIIGLIVVLCVALAATTIGSWQSQSRMADQMSDRVESIFASRPRRFDSLSRPPCLKNQSLKLVRLANDVFYRGRNPRTTAANTNLTP